MHPGVRVGDAGDAWCRNCPGLELAACRCVAHRRVVADQCDDLCRQLADLALRRVGRVRLTSCSRADIVAAERESPIAADREHLVHPAVGANKAPSRRDRGEPGCACAGDCGRSVGDRDGPCPVPAHGAAFLMLSVRMSEMNADPRSTWCGLVLKSDRPA